MGNAEHRLLLENIRKVNFTSYRSFKTCVYIVHPLLAPLLFPETAEAATFPHTGPRLAHELHKLDSSRSGALFLPATEISETSAGLQVIPDAGFKVLMGWILAM